MLSLTSASAVGFAPVVSHVARAGQVKMETAADLVSLAEKCNPKVGFYDPMNLVASSGTPEATIGWLRHAEIKHGRVAMAAFVGFIVQSNGIYFPWDLAGGVSHASISAAGGPGDQWDALPTAAKVQILGFIGLLELYSETSFFLKEAGQKHYVYGGKPGFFPPFSECSLPHPVPLNLWDPFGFTKALSPEQKAKKLNAEVNNGAPRPGRNAAAVGSIHPCCALPNVYADAVLCGVRWQAALR